MKWGSGGTKRPCDKAPDRTLALLDLYLRRRRGRGPACSLRGRLEGLFGRHEGGSAVAEARGRVMASDHPLVVSPRPPQGRAPYYR